MPTSSTTKARDFWDARRRGERLPEHELHDCEDCGEPATRQTADGVWLCEGDFELLLERAFWSEQAEASL